LPSFNQYNLGIFPKAIRINARVVRWHTDEVEQWLEEKKNRHQNRADRR
jgi:predicted DNA-binding transcriptional regulator AlpA